MQACYARETKAATETSAKATEKVETPAPQPAVAPA
jgi:hypothetical protein